MAERSDQQEDRKKACDDEALLMTQFAADHAPDAVFWIDENAQFVYVNQAACHSLEYSCEELLQMGVPDIDPTWPMDKWVAMWDSLREQGASTFETVHKTKHGRIFPVEIRANFIDYHGRSLDCAYARDISERKKAEEALRFTQFAVDNASDEAFWLTPDARIIYVNNAVCHLLGYTREELLNMTVHDIGPEYPPEVWKPHWRELREKRTMVFESVHKAKDGRLIPVEITANFVEFEGSEYNCAIARDITERKASEEKLRFTQYAIDSISDMALWITPDARIIYANKATTELLGYTREELLGMTVFDLNAGFTPEIWPAHWDEVREKRVVTLEGLLNANDGHVVPAEVRVNFVEFEGKEYHYTFVRDLTEQKKAEAEKRAMEQRLDEHKRKFYRETILSVTDGKLDICDPADLRHYLHNAQAKIDVRQASDAAEARGAVAGFCHLLGMPDDKTSAFVIGAGEAIANALKHGSGGRVYAGTANNEVWVGVKDKGPGIESLILPRAVLRKGFSTKPSLGLGYSIMLDVADRILLRTSTFGTTVVLIKYLNEDTPASFDSIPDTWEGIPDVVS